MKSLLLPLLFFILLGPVATEAKIGVGVGTGSIRVEETLNSGKTYQLPSLVVLNTGDETSAYGVSLIYRESQSELKPDPEWFTFEPAEFNLAPGESKTVRISLTLPLRGAAAGDYFAFLQAFPVQKISTEGGTSVGVAAAAKLYFTVEHSNFLTATYYRLSEIYGRYHPWSTVVLVVLFIIIFLGLFGRRFKIQVARK